MQPVSRPEVIRRWWRQRLVASVADPEGNIAMTISKTRGAKQWVMVVMAILLLGASAWSFNLATYNWFAADLHDKYSHVYASRGNIFSVVALALFAGFVLMVVRILRSWKKRRMAQA